jgi:hypothetical protein
MAALLHATDGNCLVRSVPRLQRHLCTTTATHTEQEHTLIRFEVLTAVTMKNGVLWDITPCCSYKIRRFDLVFLRSVCRLLVTASVIPSSPILVTLMKEALSSSETSVLTRAT